MTPETPRVQALPFWFQLFLIALLLPGAFCLRFRRVDAFALGFTAFLVLLAVAVQLLPGLTERYATNEAPRPVAASPFDRLGVVWLLCIPFAPLVVWLIGSLTVVTDDKWQLILGSKVFVCVVLPVVGLLPLLRYIRRDAVAISLGILAVGTLFPVSFGLPALADLWAGPQREDVVIREVRPVVSTARGRTEATELYEVVLEDGRTFEAHRRIGAVEVGPRRIVFLRASELLLGVVHLDGH